GANRRTSTRVPDIGEHLRLAAASRRLRVREDAAALSRPLPDRRPAERLREVGRMDPFQPAAPKLTVQGFHLGVILQRLVGCRAPAATLAWPLAQHVHTA